MSYQLLIQTDKDNLELQTLYQSAKTAYKGDAGIDIYIPEKIVIPAHQTKCINFQISCEMINLETNTSVSYWLMPRSSICKTPLRMSNSIGLIDSGYRQHLMAYVDNISKDHYVIEKGTRLFQLVSPTLGSINVKLVDLLSTSERGLNGFGSSGK